MRTRFLGLRTRRRTQHAQLPQAWYVFGAMYTPERRPADETPRPHAPGCSCRWVYTHDSTRACWTVHRLCGAQRVNVSCNRNVPDADNMARAAELAQTLNRVYGTA